MRNEIIYILTFPAAMLIGLSVLFINVNINNGNPYDTIAMVYVVIVFCAIPTFGMILLRLLVYKKYAWTIAIIAIVLLYETWIK